LRFSVSGSIKRENLFFIGWSMMEEALDKIPPIALGMKVKREKKKKRNTLDSEV